MAPINDLNDILYFSGVEEEASKLIACKKKIETDPHKKVRWIWDLIRYAKEASNGLNPLEICITVKDDRFVFSYQSSVFTVKKLSELVRHSNINTSNLVGLDREILSKFSRSLLTTFALSDVIKLQGFIQKDKMKQKQSSVVKLQPGVEFEPEKTFQQFRILLDRRNNCREQTLTDKIVACEKSLQNQLDCNAELPKNDLPEFTTVFTFYELSEDSFVMVDEAIKTLELSLQYLLLFNPIISTVMCKDERSQPKFETFIYKRQIDKSILGFKMLHISCKTKHQEIFQSLIYDQNQSSTVAIPVSISQEGVVGRQPIHTDTLKIYNGLPVVGCSDLGFNFVFSSQQLNQSLFLGGLNLDEEEESQKCLQNWDILYKVFNIAQKLIIKVAEISTFGYQHILRLSQMDILMKYPLFEGKFRDCFMETKKIVANQPIIISQEATGKIEEIIFLNDFACGQLTAKEYSGELNESFSFLFGPYALDKTTHQNYYDTIKSTEVDWPQIRHVGLMECLKELEGQTFQQLMKICDSQEDLFFQKMNNVYSFLTKHHPELLRDSKGLGIILCVDGSFHRISESQPIYHRGDLSHSHEMLAKQLNITMKEKFIFELFAHHFSHLPRFDAKSVSKMYSQRFGDLRKASKISLLDYLHTLGCVLQTFGRSTKRFQIYQSLKDAAPLKSFELDGKPCFSEKKDDMDKFINSLKYHFEKALLEKIQEGMEDRQQLMDYAHLHLKQEYQVQKNAINWFANLSKTCKKKLQYGLNWGLHLYRKIHLKRFVTLKEPHVDMDLSNYPNQEDLSFVNNLKQILKHLDGDKARRHPDLNFMWHLPHPSSNFSHYLQASSEIVTVKDIYSQIHLDKYDEWPNEAKLALISQLNRWSLQKQDDSTLFLKEKIAYFESFIARIPTELMRLTQQNISVSQKQVMYKFYTDSVAREAMTEIVKSDLYTEITIGIRNRKRNAKEKEIPQDVKIEPKE